MTLPETVNKVAHFIIQFSALTSELQAQIGFFPH